MSIISTLICTGYAADWCNFMFASINSTSYMQCVLVSGFYDVSRNSLKLIMLTLLYILPCLANSLTLSLSKCAWTCQTISAMCYKHGLVLVDNKCCFYV